jgi:carbon monoxide dehydrogenase subunit G
LLKDGVLHAGREERTMVTFEKTVEINRPQQDVFDFISDPANDALYRSGVEFAEWTSEPPAGVGSTMRSVDRFMGREVETTSEFTIWDPPNRYAFKTVGGSFPAEFTLELEPTEDGTQVIMRGQIEFKGLLKLVEWILGHQIKQQAQGDFDRLKLLLEEG